MKKQFLNQLLNFIWTFLCFAPVLFFWFSAGLGKWFYVFIAISFCSGFLPSRFLKLSNNPGFYEKSGAKWIRKFVQNGDFVNRLVSTSDMGSSKIKNIDYAEKYLKTIMMYEKYHFICFIFFTLSVILAAFGQEFIYFILITVSNIVYNICPIILQQYNRARIQKLRK